MANELIEAFRWLDQTPAARVGVVSSAGKFFTSGIDLEYLQQIQLDVLGKPAEIRRAHLQQIISHLQQVTLAIEECRKPVVAAIHSICFGFGVDLAAACDLRYCSKRARFSVKEVDLAIVADMGTLQRLPGLVGEGRARELAFTGRDFYGPEAESINFVNQCFPDQEQLQQHVATLAQSLAEKSPRTLRGIKQSMNFSRDQSLRQGLEQIAEANSIDLIEGDLNEVVAARVEKRKASFPD